MNPSESVQVHVPRLVRPVDAAVLSARVGRVAFGLIMSVGALAMFAAPVVLVPRPPSDEPLIIMTATWALACVSRIIITLFGPRLVRHVLPADERWLRASLALPAVGYALLLPLTLHAIAIELFDLGHFPSWVLLSGAIVGHVHLALALLAVRRAFRLVNNEPAMSPGKILAIVVALSCVPGIVFLAIPPVLVALTGVPFLVILEDQRRVLLRERARLSSARATE